MTKDKVNLLDRAGTVIALIAMIGLAWSTVLWANEADSLPRSPNLATGNTYRRNIHGLSVYQTFDEKRMLDSVDQSSHWLFVLGLFLRLAAKYQRDKAT